MQPACERPKNKRCPPTKREEMKERLKKNKPKPKCASASSSLQPLKSKDALLTEALQEAATQEEESMELKNSDNVPEWRPKPKKPKKIKDGPCRIPRFPFPKCGYPKKEDQTVGCPPKKKKPLIDDCPPCGKCTFNGEKDFEGVYQMAKKVKQDKSKCPHVDMTVNREVGVVFVAFSTFFKNSFCLYRMKKMILAICGDEEPPRSVPGIYSKRKGGGQGRRLVELCPLRRESKKNRLSRPPRLRKCCVV